MEMTNNWIAMDGNMDWDADVELVPLSPADWERLSRKAYELLGDGDEVDLDELTATHVAIQVIIPEEYHEEGYDDDEVTWWDVSVVLAKQVDGVWYLYGEEDSIGGLWYQSTYTQQEARDVAQIHNDYAVRGQLYAGEYIGELVYRASSLRMDW